MRKFLPVFLFASMALAGCSIGKPYIHPTATEPSAEIILQGEDIEVVNMDDRGCYSGTTRIHRASGEPGKEAGFRVHAGRKLVLHYQGYTTAARYAGKTCSVEFYFAPRKDAKYTPVTGYEHKRNENASTFVKLLGGDEKDLCTVEMMEDAADGTHSSVHLTKTRPMQSGFTCIRF